MKTPRDILLERHHAAAPRLDAIRRSVVRELNNQATKKRSLSAGLVALFLGCSNAVWSELILPSRRVWAGLAAVWLLIFAVNLSMRDRSPSGVMASAPPQMMLTFRQQEQLLTELLGPDEVRVAEPATPSLPRPRSEGRLDILMT
ncbi:MAG TPA: hypothetical protein VFY06_11480 [Verrucomicrobiae bacterium]|nr:hypothetical protein [Verrucomicrobiae bacterium]